MNYFDRVKTAAESMYSDRSINTDSYCEMLKVIHQCRIIWATQEYTEEQLKVRVPSYAETLIKNANMVWAHLLSSDQLGTEVTLVCDAKRKITDQGNSCISYVPLSDEEKEHLNLPVSSRYAWRIKIYPKF